MKYIDADKIKARIDGIIDGLKRNCTPDPMGTTEECMAAAEIEALEIVKSVIDQMQQEEPTPPGIEEESKKKGWLDYGLMVSEIGLHRYNAIHRIRESKVQSVADMMGTGLIAYDCTAVRGGYRLKVLTSQVFKTFLDTLKPGVTVTNSHGREFTIESEPFVSNLRMCVRANGDTWFCDTLYDKDKDYGKED